MIQDKVMHFGRRNVGYNYHLDSKSLDEVSEEKDLGVTITCDLKASQVNSVPMHIVKQIGYSVS